MLTTGKLRLEFVKWLCFIIFFNVKINLGQYRLSFSEKFFTLTKNSNKFFWSELKTGVFVQRLITYTLNYTF